jgi:hypothetical protein
VFCGAAGVGALLLPPGVAFGIGAILLLPGVAFGIGAILLLPGVAFGIFGVGLAYGVAVAGATGVAAGFAVFLAIASKVSPFFTV